MTKNNKTQRKIFEAAASLFLEKGVDRTSVRDIAAKAGINLALMNYYFKSKENLFTRVFTDLLQKNAGPLVEIQESELPLEEKIRKYVVQYIDVLAENPLMVSFVISIVHRSHDHISQVEWVDHLYINEKFHNQIKEEIGKTNGIYSDSSQFLVDMLSLIIFPFSISPLIMERNKFDKKEFQDFIQQRKKHVPEILIRNLKNK